ncbi:MAG: class I SAM-dependent methyltransferase [Actinobacteria bacterium]|nr:class I SAM-dependent methyltransferase [Actinomycetota bacterium]
MASHPGPLRRLLRQLYRFPNATYNHASRRNLRRFSALMAARVAVPGTRILNVGGGNRIWAPDVVRPDVQAATLNIDIRASPRVACVADAQRLPFASETFAGLLSTAVLEHLPDAARAIAEMRRVARPGAWLYVEAPFLQGFHASPNDYQRFTGPGLRHALRAFEHVSVGVCVGPSSALSWVVRGYLKGLLSGFSRRKRAQQLAEFVAAWLTFPIKYADRWVADRPAAEDLASGFYAFARVPSAGPGTAGRPDLG